MMKNPTRFNHIFILALIIGCFIMPTTAQAVSEITTRASTPHQETPASSPVGVECSSVCNCNCRSKIEKNHVDIRNHKTAEFVKHRGWMINELWKAHVRPAMAMMASQLTAGAVQQVFIIGTFFDAKHQLETQRIFQQLMAEAHRDYMPSEGVCEVGTATRSLAASDRKTPLAQTILSERSLDRQLRAKDTISGADLDADIRSRLANFAENNCSANDNAGGLEWLCKNKGTSSSGGNTNTNNTNTQPTAPNIATINQAGNTVTGNNAGNITSNNSTTPNINPVNLNNNGGNNSNANGAGNTNASRFSVRGRFPNGGNNQTIFDYRTINFNDGTDFNNRTGQYTAPQDGEYNFTATVTLNNPAEIGTVSLRKNNRSILDRAGTRTGVQNIRITSTLQLKRGDRITLFTNSPLTSGNHSFTGSLNSSNNNGTGSNGGNNGTGGNGGNNGGGVAGDINDPVNQATADQKEKRNRDVDFTKSVLAKPTLDIEVTPDGVTELSDDAQALFALSANLFGHEPLAFAPAITIADANGQPKSNATRYLDLRSIAAKRSVAQNSFSAITAERFSGDTQSAPYIRKIIEELGIPPEEMDDFLGEKPSYNAQMEVLTKRIVQNPVFYTELYDKPANVLRKQAMLRAINLMQERDLYKSQLRQEMALAVALETMLHDEDKRVRAAIDGLSPGGRPAFNE